PLHLGSRRQAQSYRGRSRAYLASPSFFSSFLYSDHHWRNGFSPRFRFRTPRARLMAAPVIGFSKITSGVVCTTAFVPFSISNSRRIRRGMTICPFTVNETVSGFVVAAMAKCKENGDQYVYV